MTMPSHSVPMDFTHMMNSLYYKRGRHGLVFVWLDGGWVRSTKKAHELFNGHSSPRKDGTENNRGKHRRMNHV